MSPVRFAMSLAVVAGACSSQAPAEKAVGVPAIAAAPPTRPIDAGLVTDASVAMDAPLTLPDDPPPSREQTDCSLHVATACDRLKAGCDHGDAHACFELAEVARMDAPAQARKLYAAACKVPGGPYDGCVGLAVLMCEGRGGAKAPHMAIELLDAACDAGAAPSCSLIGLYYTEGLCELHYTEAEWRRGVAYYEHGCALGRLPACTHLGGLVRAGHGVPKDEARGRKILDDACTRGDSVACSYLKSP